MQNKCNRKAVRFRNYWRRTFRNKLAALSLILIGIMPLVLERDATMLAFATMIAIPLFFTRERYV